MPKKSSYSTATLAATFSSVLLTWCCGGSLAQMPSSSCCAPPASMPPPATPSCISTPRDTVSNTVQGQAGIPGDFGAVATVTADPTPVPTELAPPPPSDNIASMLAAVLLAEAFEGDNDDDQPPIDERTVNRRAALVYLAYYLLQMNHMMNSGPIGAPAPYAPPTVTTTPPAPNPTQSTPPATPAPANPTAAAPPPTPQPNPPMDPAKEAQLKNIDEAIAATQNDLNRAQNDVFNAATPAQQLDAQQRLDAARSKLNSLQSQADSLNR